MPGPDGLGFQLYSAREFPPLEARMRLLAELGYTHVEPYGALLERRAELEAALAATGLKAPTTHIALDRLRSDLDDAAAELQALGVETAIIPYLLPATRPTDSEGWRQLGHEVAAADPLADPGEIEREHAIEPIEPEGRAFDLVIGAVAHRSYRELPGARLGAMVAPSGTLADLKGMWRSLILDPSVDRRTL